MMKVPFFDLSRQTAALRDELEPALMAVVDSQRFVLGPAVERIESEIAEALAVKHAVGVASGTDALLLALMALDVGPGDEVIAPAFSFFATASCISRLGARPVFADIDLKTFQVDPDQIRRRITPRTRAVIAVHLYGDCADLPAIQSIAAHQGIPVVEDAAQAFGARIHGQAAGAVGFCGCLSFYPTKNLPAVGDAGMIVTNDAGAAERFRMLRVHGAESRYEHTALGINSRLDSLQAAALSVRLPRVEGWNRRRREIADRYRAALDGVVAAPASDAANYAVYHQFVVRTERREALRAHLAAEGVGTEVYYPIPLHLQKAFGADAGAVGDCPRAEEAARTCLALPIFPELRDDEVDYVIRSVLAFFAD